MKRFLLAVFFLFSLVSILIGQEAPSNPSSTSTMLTPAADDRVPCPLVSDMAIRSELSTLWTAVYLDLITADILTLYIPGAMEEFTDLADGNEESIMAAAAVMHQIPIAMIYLTKKLPYQKARMANMAVAG